jgi:membrane associated rhomboid family serine protease
VHLQHGGVAHSKHVVGCGGGLLEALVSNRLPHPHLQVDTDAQASSRTVLI